MASIGEKIKKALIKEDPQVSKEVAQDNTNVSAQIPVSSMGSISSSFAPTSTIEQSTPARDISLRTDTNHLTKSDIDFLFINHWSRRFRQHSMC